MEIRAGRESDCTAVQEIWSSCGLPAASDREWEVLIDGDSASLLVAAEGDNVLGAGVIAYDGWRAYIYHVAVSTDARRRGVGQAIMAEGERLLAAKGASLVFALAKESMTDGLALLGASGYEPEGDIAFVKPLGRQRTWPRLVRDRG